MIGKRRTETLVKSEQRELGALVLAQPRTNVVSSESAQRSEASKPVRARFSSRT